MTSDPKKKRLSNKELLSQFRDKPCHISNYACQGLVSGHHIISRDAGGADSEEKLIALCLYHHRQIHQIGTSKFLDKYPELQSKLAKKH